MQSRTWLAAPANLSPLGIHDDATARALGFQGGFVPGVAVYEHIVAELLAQGIDWLRMGSVEFRFRKPVYDREDVRFTIDGEAGTFSVTSPDGSEERASGTLGIAGEPPSVPEVPPVTPAWGPLGAPEQIGLPLELRVPTDPERAAHSKQLTGFPWREGERDLYPVGLWLNPVDLLKAHFDNPTTIHYAGRVWHHSPVYLGETVVRRGHITGFEERRGNKLVAFTVAVSAGDGRPVATIEHTSVYELAQARQTAAPAPEAR